MSDFRIFVGSTSRRVPVFIQDSAAGDGSGLTGLTNATSGLTCYYWRGDEGNAGATSVSLQSATRGTFTSAGFVEKDATNMPGWYEFGIPDAALASGADQVAIMFKGGTAGLVPRIITIELIPLPSLAKNKALSAFVFPLVNSSGGAVTGATVTAQRSIDGAALGSCSNSVTEISAGLYKIDLTATDLNGSVIELHFTATSALDVNYTLLMQPIIP